MLRFNDNQKAKYYCTMVTQLNSETIRLLLKELESVAGFRPCLHAFKT